MFDLTTINVAYTGLKFAKETFQVLLGLKIEAGTLARITDAMEKLGATQDTLFELRGELYRLQTDNEKLRQDLKAREDWEALKAQYPVVQTLGGAVVRASTVEPKHLVCPSCFETYREIQYLQSIASGRFDCPRCKTAYSVGAPQPIRVERATSSRNAWDDDDRY